MDFHFCGSLLNCNALPICAFMSLFSFQPNTRLRKWQILIGELCKS